MEDNRIVDLYWQRNESAISETATKYGKYLHSISYQILLNTEDAEECVNDTYNDAWQSMPPHRPSILSTFLGKITRRISIDLWRKYSAEKCGGGEVALALDELEECVSGTGSVGLLRLNDTAIHGKVLSKWDFLRLPMAYRGNGVVAIPKR